ncbi:YihY/virulence factor BrkB family protein [Conexibacter sp. JD483]|uniref:YihY/virulence factor BrkB family protein n=1 Tax=unclassified Conexibacter TaxID=2627773 RepID=UPI0027200C04|nr:MULTISPECIES: YihY/virulence factor BrkB family protein [unclassified Conexibacter]MDO8184603.1 YihY/virulence factor BrkB family protein [Conexibacter sp. CPCC 205706]MDO8197909.1 YihY/virulence factor BrkB family protein [Conexibacter sp. CPCC 205762]MDR9370126.1 YihY/virulence factor BrkB family protein [Conexibacter sp. JD483]
MRRSLRIGKRALIAFYDDQMTQHAAALTYYGLMSLFPALLLAVSLLGLVGQYPTTYNAIMSYLREVAPASALDPLDSSLRSAFQHKGTAATTLALSIVIAFYGATGVLESARRALNVVFGVSGGRSFLHRKTVDVLSTVVLMTLILVSLVLVFVGGRFAEDLLGFAGFGTQVADVWNLARWPAAVAVAVLVFSFLYTVTPDLRQRSFRWLTPGAGVGVALWLGASWGFATYISRVADVGALYGAFAGAIVLVGWIWLSNVALLLGAELNAAIAADALQLARRPEKRGEHNRDEPDHEPGGPTGDVLRDEDRAEHDGDRDDAAGRDQPHEDALDGEPPVLPRGHHPLRLRTAPAPLLALQPALGALVGLLH